MKTLFLLPLLFLAVSLSAQVDYADSKTTLTSTKYSLTLATTDTYLANSFQNSYYIRNYQSHFDEEQGKTVYTFEFKRNEQIVVLVLERINTYSEEMALK